MTPGESVTTDFLLWLRARLAAYPKLAESEMELLLVAEEVFTNILKYGEMPAGGEVQVSLRVDELLGNEDIVIKSLSENFVHIDGLSGASILGDGTVCLMLDVGALMNLGARTKEKAPELDPR